MPHCLRCINNPDSDSYGEVLTAQIIRVHNLLRNLCMHVLEPLATIRHANHMGRVCAPQIQPSILTARLTICGLQRPSIGYCHTHSGDERGSKADSAEKHDKPRGPHPVPLQCVHLHHCTGDGPRIPGPELEARGNTTAVMRVPMKPWLATVMTSTRSFVETPLRLTRSASFFVECGSSV
jgi:hypothetical protein